MDSIPKVVVGGFETTRLSRAGLCEVMRHDCLAARRGERPPRVVVDLNGHGLAMARWQPAFRQALEAADIIHADGQAAVMASRLLTSTPIAGRSATTDLFHDAAAVAAEAGLGFFLLGATEEVNERCAAEMQRRHPGLRIAGRRHGYFDEPEEPAICEAINRTGADIIWVGLGKPKEHLFSIRNRDRLKAGWVVTCGGCFNYVTETYGRAPGWMQAAGFEWLYRVLADPRRFGWRYLTTNPVAMFLLLTRTRRVAPAESGA